MNDGFDGHARSMAAALLGLPAQVPDLDEDLDLLMPYMIIPSGLSLDALLDSPARYVDDLQVSSSTLSEQLRFGDVNKENQSRFGMQHEYNPVCFEDIGTYDAALPIDIHSEVKPAGPKCVAMQRYHHNRDTELPTEVPIQKQQLPKGDQAGGFPRTGTGRPIEDGYNWKKYGQKQVKGSEYPRSYYKCTHPTCLVKKKVEHALDGQIREIIYRGSHNHPAPQAIHQSAFVSSHGQNNKMQDSAEDPSSHWRFDGQKMTPSASTNTELPDALSGSKRKNSSLLTDELLSALTCEDDDKNGDMQGSMLHGDDGEFDEPEAKRKKEYCLTESSSASRAIRESRIVVQTVSDVDILEDGYRWRKYGQKVVKGNPNPRSYYKCTHPGCLVRKHIERAPNDLRSVITTYEGKHNHEVPTARTSNDIGSGGNSQLPPPNAQDPMTVPGSANAPKPEPKRQDFDSCFENNLEFCGNYLKQRYPGSVPPFSGVQLPLLPSFPFSHMITKQHTCQDLSFPFHMGVNSYSSGSSSAAMSSYELSQASSNVPAYQYLGVPLPNVEHMSVPRLMKKEMHTHGSPDSPLSSHAEFSPPPYE